MYKKMLISIVAIVLSHLSLMCFVVMAASMETIDVKQSFDVTKLKLQMIKLTSQSADIVLKPSSNDTISVRLSGLAKNTPEHFDATVLLSSTVNGEMLEVECENKTRSLHLRTDNLVLEVSVPRTLKPHLFVATTSGDLKLSELVVDSIHLNTQSGDIESEGVNAKRFQVMTVSGDVEMDAAGPVSFKTVSGDVTLRLDHLTDALEGQSVSGDVNVQLSAAADARVQLKTVSGEIGSKLSLRESRTRKNSLSGAIGKGTHAVNISTTSGEIRLAPL